MLNLINELNNNLIVNKLNFEFIEQTRQIIGEDLELFLKSFSEKSPISIRLNPYKNKNSDCPFLQTDDKVPWASHAYYLSERPVFTLDPLFHAGVYYVQDASSMYLEPLIKKYVSSPSIVLDLCAAPGGKSTHLSAILPEDSLLVSNEVIRSRANILMENLIKWGRPDTIIINNDPSEIAVSQRFFDVIVADVPCSGEGMFRKDPKSNQEWSPENVKLCAERQKRIIADIWPALKPGGILIYSTCTYNKRENEENLDWISRRLGAELLEEPRRLMPHQVKGEGFFIAALRKTAEEGKSSASAVSKKTNRLKNESKLPIPQEVKKYLLNAEKFSVINDDHTIKAVPTKYRTHYELLKRLNILNVGISLAKVKGKDIIPLHSLAMSVELNPSAFPVLEMSKEDALRYLRKESTFEIPTNLPKGYVLVCYQGNPLGFIKNIGNRINNLYPNEWRIRMQIPGENVSGG